MRPIIRTLLIALVSISTLTQCVDAYSGLRGSPLFLDPASRQLPEGDNSTGVRIAEPSQRYVQGADPFVLKDGADSYYLYTTNRPKINVPVYRIEHLDTLAFLGDALPDMPSWARRGFTWAPEVLKLNSNNYILWYTARDTASDKQCIGRAVSDKPMGPFIDDSNRSFICDEQRDTSIDPSPYRDADGKLYLLWKTREGHGQKTKTIIWLSQLDEEGNLMPDATQPLLTNDRDWEGKHIEAPTLLRLKGQYYLFYSAGGSTPNGYLVSYATSNRIEGPYTKSNDFIVGGRRGMRGSGHQTVVQLKSGQYLIYYHGVHKDRRTTKEGKARFLDFSYLCFPRGKPEAQDHPCLQ